MDNFSNWSNSNAISAHYDKLIKRYLTINKVTDLTKYRFAIEFYHIVFLQWDYPNLQEPCIERLKKLDRNYFKFDLEDTVPVLTNRINETIIRTLTINTSENCHFSSSIYFHAPTFGYFANMTNSEGVAYGAKININPISVTKQDDKWLFKYDITSDMVGSIKVRFQMKYSYYWDDEEEEAAETEEIIVPTFRVRNTFGSSSLRNPKEMKKIYPALDLQKDIKGSNANLAHISINPNQVKTSKNNNRGTGSSHEAKLISQSTLQKLNTLNGNSRGNIH